MTGLGVVILPALLLRRNMMNEFYILAIGLFVYGVLNGFTDISDNTKIPIWLAFAYTLVITFLLFLGMEIG